MRAAISPDGKYVAYVMEEAGRQSLWLRHVPTNSDTQIIENKEANYRGVTFSPDGNFIYYVRGKPRDPVGENLDASGALYKTTILGKDEKKLIDKVHHSIILSPEGARIAFVRQSLSEGKSVLVVANADGSGEKPLITRTSTHPFSNDGGLAWSPDGEIIACVIRNMTPSLYRSVVGVRVADGVEIPLTSHKWYGVMKDVEWLPDGSGLLILGEERVGNSHQIWRLSYPGDDLQKVTDDLNDYLDLSLAATSGTLATVRSDRLVNIWIAPNGDASRARQITTGAGRQDGLGGLAWTPDGKIVYISTAGGPPHVWIMEADGTGNKQLSSNDIANMHSTVSPDGRRIAWIASPKGVRNVWQMDIDGGNPRQLTNGDGEWNPRYSPDGKWLVYTALPNSLWKVPLDGGSPTRLTNGRSWQPSISPDGDLIAFNLLDEASGQWKIAIMRFEGGLPIKVFDNLGGNYRRIVWTPDARAVAFTVYRDGVANIWAQPLEGGPPRRLTNFRDGLIFDFAWSRDGKQLALSRALINSDVALIQNFK
jgi:Tol biopolymer transport system component